MPAEVLAFTPDFAARVLGSEGHLSLLRLAYPDGIGAMSMAWVVNVLRSTPELAMFLAVGAGYWFGSIRFGRFSLGTVTAALIVGLLIGQLHIEVSRELRWGLFLLFLFSNGYAAGPQFFQALKDDGVKPMLLSVTVLVAGLGTTWLLARLLHLDPGMAAGLFSGGLTQSAAMGTAIDGIMSLPLSIEERKLLANHVAVADALTYVFGAIGMIFFVSVLGPRLLGVNLREEAALLERKYGIRKSDSGIFTADQKFIARTYTLVEPAFVGKTVRDVEREALPFRLFVESIQREAGQFSASPDTLLQRGDTIVIYGRIEGLIKIAQWIGPETHAPDLLRFPMEVLKVMLTNRALCKVPLRELVHSAGFSFRSVGLRSITRGKERIPIGTDTVLCQGDILELIGPQRAVEEAAAEIGTALRTNHVSSLSTLCLGIVGGALVGVPYALVGSVKLTLSISVGTLLAGLLLGWWRSLKPARGSIPPAALELMISFGLAAFVACAGIQAGPDFVQAVRELGLKLLLGGVAVTLIPQFAALLVGRYVLRMNPLLLLGGLAGAQTFTAALAALQEKSDSPIAVLGYTVPYATSNILLTSCGALVVALTAI